MRSVTEEIKEKLNVVDVLKQYIEVMPAGKNFKAKCPFHGDNSPSLMVSPERQSWHCFGCNVGGDIFTFVTKYENIEFFEALRILAEKAGVELKRISPAEHRQFGVLYDINEEAKNFFKEQLAFRAGTKEYLKERGLREETIEEFELGAAPQGWDELLVRLVNKGFEPADITRAGLVLKSEQRGNYFDRFRNRVMFPIMNHAGKTVGFTGRVMPEFEEKEAMGKYVNSPETPIFSKSRILYGFNKTKGQIREMKKAFVVEGQMDMLMAWQDGMKNAVASSGTAFTAEHAQAIARLADEIILNFDNDEAGKLADERAIDLALKADLGVKVLSFDSFKDVAELVKASPGKLCGLAEAAMPAMEFYFERYLKDKSGGSALEVKKGTRKALSRIKIIPSAVERDFWLKNLSRKTGINEEALKEEMAGIEEKPEAEAVAERKEIQVSVPDIFTRVELLSQRLISAALFQGDLEAAAASVELMPESFRKVLEAVKISKKEGEDQETKRLVDLIHLRSGLLESENLDELKKQLKMEFLKRKKNDFLERIRKIEGENGEGENLNEAIGEFQKVSMELNEMMK
ncbi:MAG: DNA primase [Candidatus Paceibacterota bacterium]